MSDVTDVLKQYSKDVVKTIEENLSVIEPQDLQDACLYLTKAGGKMLRPALTLISAEAVGGTGSQHRLFVRRNRSSGKEQERQ